LFSFFEQAELNSEHFNVVLQQCYQVRKQSSFDVQTILHLNRRMLSISQLAHL